MKRLIVLPIAPRCYRDESCGGAAPAPMDHTSFRAFLTCWPVMGTSQAAPRLPIFRRSSALQSSIFRLAYWRRIGQKVFHCTRSSLTAHSFIGGGSVSHGLALTFPKRVFT